MDKAFIGLGIKREEVYIANIVKCRPPQNRNPEKDEAEACMGYLRAQVMLVKPKVIVLLGSVALKNILGDSYRNNCFKGKMDRKEWSVIYANLASSSAFERRDKENRFLEGFKRGTKKARKYVGQFRRRKWR